MNDMSPPPKTEAEAALEFVRLLRRGFADTGDKLLAYRIVVINLLKDAAEESGLPFPELELLNVAINPLTRNKAPINSPPQPSSKSGDAPVRLNTTSLTNKQPHDQRAHHPDATDEPKIFSSKFLIKFPQYREAFRQAGILTVHDLGVRLYSLGHYKTAASAEQTASNYLRMHGPAAEGSPFRNTTGQRVWELIKDYVEAAPVAISIDSVAAAPAPTAIEGEAGSVDTEAESPAAAVATTAPLPTEPELPPATATASTAEVATDFSAASTEVAAIVEHAPTPLAKRYIPTTPTADLDNFFALYYASKTPVPEDRRAKDRELTATLKAATAGHADGSVTSLQGLAARRKAGLQILPVTKKVLEHLAERAKNLGINSWLQVGQFRPAETHAPHGMPKVAGNNGSLNTDGALGTHLERWDEFRRTATSRATSGTPAPTPATKAVIARDFAQIDLSSPSKPDHHLMMDLMERLMKHRSVAFVVNTATDAHKIDARCLAPLPISHLLAPEHGQSEAYAHRLHTGLREMGVIAETNGSLSFTEAFKTRFGDVVDLYRRKQALASLAQPAKGGHTHYRHG